MSWKITPLYFCSSNNIYFAHKEPIKTKKKFRLFECSGQNLWSSCQFKTTSQFLLNFCVTLHCHDTQLHCKFEAHKFSTLDKKILSKFQFWHLQVPWWKFAKFLMSFSKCNKPVILQILRHSSVSSKIIPLYFLAQTIYTLLKRTSFKWKFLTLSSARVKFCQIL